MGKIKYYDISPLLEHEASYYMLLGQRANGKSYQAKKTALEDSFERGQKFIYLRRWVSDIKQKFVTRYFDDMPIKEITHGEYESIEAYAGDIYFCRIDEKTQKPVRVLKAGSYCALNEVERYKSQAWPQYRNIIYEEFITDELYLDDEPKKLMQFCSTVVRHNMGRVFLIGNTLSRVCPYFEEWCLDKVLKQAIGTIDMYHFHSINEDGSESIINLAVEYCANAKGVQNTMFFGRASKQIVSGEWDTYDSPRKPNCRWNTIYEIEVQYSAFRFCAQLLIGDDGLDRCIFIYPLTKPRKIRRIITNDFSTDYFTTPSLRKDLRPEAMMIELFRLNKVCYSDNLTASDFKHAIAEMNIY